MDALEKLKLFEDSERTHLNRFNIILGKYVKNLGEYVDLFKKYPANSIEFKVEAIKLYYSIAEICSESKENMDDIVKDLTLMIDVLKTFNKEIEKIPDDD